MDHIIYPWFGIKANFEVENNGPYTVVFGIKASSKVLNIMDHIPLCLHEGQHFGMKAVIFQGWSLRRGVSTFLAHPLCALGFGMTAMMLGTLEVQVLVM